MSRYKTKYLITYITPFDLDEDCTSIYSDNYDLLERCFLKLRSENKKPILFEHNPIINEYEIVGGWESLHD